MAGIPTIAPYPLPQPGALPHSTARWRLDPRRAVLLVHDAQEYFLRPLPMELRVLIQRNIALLRRWSADSGVPVAYTAQPGDMTEQDRGLLADFWGPGMRVTPADQAVPDAIRPRPGDWVFTKWRYSAFFRTGLLERIRESGRDQLVVCGVYASIGIQTTCVDAYSHDIQPFLAGDAVADFTERDHLAALSYVAARCGVVLATKEVLG
ncbi:isochorismatase family protein [Streptomyces sp.]|uniref:isochorismatase family protein n=1 Tax=Streptomyces sp. TaxID=1931 RepID=UPI002F42AA03